MGKNLTQQARGRGGPSFTAPSFRYLGEAGVKHGVTSAEIVDIVKSQGHLAPLLEVKYNDGTTGLMIAPEGVRTGQVLQVGEGAAVELGNTLFLRDVPEGTLVFNIEGMPGDGGKYCRTSGTFGKVVSKTDKAISILLPSRKIKEFNLGCRATVGIPAAAGRKEKPFLKAGTMAHYRNARKKRYPHMSGSAQNAVDHPFGNKRSSRKSKARPAPQNAPPGRKVGYIRPSRTGPSKTRAITKEVR
ncbi:MAG: 50S ribosomal protein L2 [Candidatus Woesearchaeota archaeon]